MQVTVDLSEKHISFLNRMISDMKNYEKITTLQEALVECINMAMFDENETMSAQEGM